MKSVIDEAVDSTAPVFTEAEQKTLLKHLDTLDFMPRGTLAKIARQVGCSRQFVQLVLRGPESFTRRRSNMAHRIWEQLAVAVKGRTESASVHEQILREISAGKDVSVRMNSALFRYISRKLRLLGVKTKTTRDVSTIPITYTFRPKP